MFGVCRAQLAADGVDTESLSAVTTLRLEPDMLNVLVRSSCDAGLEAALIEVAGEIGLVWADQFFSAMDRDTNGALAREEVEAIGEAVFAKADRNNDGYVTPAEVHPALASAR